MKTYRHNGEKEEGCMKWIKNDVTFERGNHREAIARFNHSRCWFRAAACIASPAPIECATALIIPKQGNSRKVILILSKTCFLDRQRGASVLELPRITAIIRPVGEGRKGDYRCTRGGRPGCWSTTASGGSLWARSTGMISAQRMMRF